MRYFNHATLKMTELNGAVLIAILSVVEEFLIFLIRFLALTMLSATSLFLISNDYKIKNNVKILVKKSTNSDKFQKKCTFPDQKFMSKNCILLTYFNTYIIQNPACRIQDN